MSYRAFIHPKNDGYDVEIQADGAALELKLTERGAARVTVLTTNEVDCLIATLQAARATMRSAPL